MNSGVTFADVPMAVSVAFGVILPVSGLGPTMRVVEHPVARVAVDVPLANLDRPFDYTVPADLDADAQPGVRVKVRFAGRLRDGYLLERCEAGEREKLSPLTKVVSPEPVLSAAVAGLVRDVADHYAGGFADVVRTAVPPRHRATELAQVSARPEPAPAEVRPGILAAYPGADRFLDALASGRPRAAWTVLPSPGPAGQWVTGFLEAAAVVLAQGRGALLLAPDARQLTVLERQCTERFGAGSFAVLAADAGPSARYRNFLAVRRGQVRLVLGTRAAVFAPVADLGLVALWDDGNDAWSEPHAPYWHAREVAALRAHREGCALLLAAHNRTAEVQQLVDRGWLAALQLPTTTTRRLAAAVRPAREASARDPLADVARVPRDAFALLRTGLAAGPVLVQVPRSGYLPVLVCTNCRAVARCPRCGQGLSGEETGPSCRWCGPLVGPWRCPDCGGARLRSPVVGVSRTAEELGKAFPGTPVVQATAEHRAGPVPDRPALVFATPGAAPEAVGGYAAAVLMDAELMLARPDLRAGEEALRRWLAVVALVRPAEEGGTVLVLGRAGLREVQALLRLDPVGYAEAELSQRAEAGFPPAARLLTVEGPHPELDSFRDRLALPASVLVTGPFPVRAADPDAGARLTLRAPLSVGPAVVASVRELQATRAARKEPALRVRVDPVVLD
jgi:primosomal protein N' (replication factor Y)